MIWIGTSGWQYRDWRGAFYPDHLPQRLWLEHFATRFATVEVNSAFYRLPGRDVFARWRAGTPADFVIAVKMSRYLTHVKRLRDPAEPVRRFLDRAEALGDRLGPVLLQLPPTLHADPEALDETLAQFPASTPVAVEPRHDSWWTAEVRKLLERHDAALCWADRCGVPVTPLWRTAGFGYLRLHQGSTGLPPRYARPALQRWSRRIRAQFIDESVYVYFNNDMRAAAIGDAIAFAETARQAGLAPSRTP